jgi:hypothetical protein
MSTRDDLPDDPEQQFDEERLRRHSQRRTLFIVLGVVGGVVLLVGAACGGLIYLGIRAFSQFPNITADADMFLDDIKSGQLDAAYERASTGFKSRQSPQQFRAFVSQYPALTTQTSRKYTGFNVFTGSGGTRGRVSATVLGPNSSLSFTLVFIQETGQWKVDQITIP